MREISGGVSFRAWTLLALGESRQFAGNTGYDDHPNRHYSYDSTVPNSRAVAVGDLALPRDSNRALGIAWIAQIDGGPGTKLRRRCPVCRTTALKERLVKQPRYRCDQGHESDHPVEEMIDVIAYRAHYVDWLPLRHELTADDLRPLYRSNGQQHAIRELDKDRVRATADHLAVVDDDRWWDGPL
jgi:hypothetical protein